MGSRGAAGAGAAGEVALVLFDLDGTLLDPRRDIRPASIAAAAALRARGIRVGVATGRTPRSAAPYVARIPANGPNIHFNGAMVWDVDEGRACWSAGLVREDASRAIEVAEAHGVHVNAYVGDEVWIARESQTSRNSADKDGLAHTVVGDLAARVRGHAVGPVKLMMIDERRPVMRLEAPIRAAIGAGCNLVNSEPEYLEMLPAGIHKGSAVARIERIYGIPRERVVAFGDRPNDVELLRAVGMGVAMGNAHPDVRAVADRVIGDNDSDAIGEFLRELLRL